MSFEKARQVKRIQRRLGMSPARRAELAEAFKGTTWWGINRHTKERVEGVYEELTDGPSGQ